MTRLPEVGHHEAAHAVAQKAWGGDVSKIHVAEGNGSSYCNVSDPESEADVRGYQIMTMAGAAAQERWLAEHGQPVWDCRSDSDKQLCKQWVGKPGGISMARAEREADRLVDREWGSIHSLSERYAPEAEYELEASW